MPVIYAPDELQPIITHSLNLLRTHWNLGLKRDLHVLVGVDWWPTIQPHLNSLQRYRRAPHLKRDEAIWANSAACALSLSHKDLILLKPQHLWHDSGMARHLFEPCSTEEQVARNLCHELTHVCTTHLRLPFWLNEGLAMLTTDLYAGQYTVKPETRDLLPNTPPLVNTADLSGMSRHEWLTAYAQAYWMTRRLAEQHSAELRERLQ